jgi:hypothetical protein
MDVENPITPGANTGPKTIEKAPQKPQKDPENELTPEKPKSEPLEIEIEKKKPDPETKSAKISTALTRLQSKLSKWKCSPAAYMRKNKYSQHHTGLLSFFQILPHLDKRSLFPV